MANVLEGDGRQVMQVFPVRNFGSTAGAATINTSDMHLIVFDTEVTIYADGNSSDTFTLPKVTPIGITELSSLHVSAATNYMYV